MKTLKNPLEQHIPAVIVFCIYALCWVGIAGLSVSGKGSSILDECGRGTLMIYPVLFGFLGSLPYWLGILLVILFTKEHTPFFLRLLAFAVLLPALLLTAVW